jgi:fibronectin type 3 domain-containing protein
MAIDRSQNHSKLSAVLKLQLPDKVKPAPPVLLPLKSSAEGVRIPWIKSSSDDVVQYDIYRSVSGKREWQRIKVIQPTEDSVYSYFDSTSTAGITAQYTVTAIDDTGLESEPAAPASGIKLNNQLRTAVDWKDPVINKESMTVKLSWKYDLDGITAFKIYKAIDENPPATYKTIPGDKKEFQDRLQPGKKYTYRILAIFNDGFKSSLSDEISINY